MWIPETRKIWEPFSSKNQLVQKESNLIVFLILHFPSCSFICTRHFALTIFQQGGSPLNLSLWNQENVSSWKYLCCFAAVKHHQLKQKRLAKLPHNARAALPWESLRKKFYPKGILGNFVILGFEVFAHFKNSWKVVATQSTKVAFYLQALLFLPNRTLYELDLPCSTHISAPHPLLEVMRPVQSGVLLVMQRNTSLFCSIRRQSNKRTHRPPRTSKTTGFLRLGTFSVVQA